jgi:hypothetical protein
VPGVDREADELAAGPEVAASADGIRDRLRRQLAQPPSEAALEFGVRQRAGDVEAEQRRQAVERERIASLWDTKVGRRERYRISSMYGFPQRTEHPRERPIPPEQRRLRLPAFQRRRGASPAIRPRVRSGRTVRRRAAARTSCRARAPADPDLDPPLGRLAHRGAGR